MERHVQTKLVKLLKLKKRKVKAGNNTKNKFSPEKKNNNASSSTCLHIKSCSKNTELCIRMIHKYTDTQKKLHNKTFP